MKIHDCCIKAVACDQLQRGQLKDQTTTASIPFAHFSIVKYLMQLQPLASASSESFEYDASYGPNEDDKTKGNGSFQAIVIFRVLLLPPVRMDAPDLP